MDQLYHSFEIRQSSRERENQAGFWRTKPVISGPFDVLDQIDVSTGKIVKEHPTLWRPSGFKIQAGRVFAFTSDSLAYALKLQL